MQVPAAAFKAYDIRGTVPEQLNPEFAHALGVAFGAMALAAGEKTVAVGRDGRLSGPELASALINGLCQAGVDVIDIGMATTPMLYFAASTLCSSGIQITGSHNPKNYNGFKMVLAGSAIYGNTIQQLRVAMENPEADSDTAKGSSTTKGTCTQQEILPAYQERIQSDITLARPMKVVVDSGNGVPGASAPGILRAIGAEVHELFSEVDGDFPNHHPDPSKPENLQDVINTLQTTDAELGLAFDGDGDRLGVVTKSGEVIFPDRQIMLFAEDILQRVPGGTVIYDVKCTQRLAPAIEQAGGTPLMYKTGHSLIKAKMREVDSPFGGEMSGHLFFKERWYGFDDGTYAACRLLEILSKHDNPSAVLEALPTSHSTPELNVATAEGEQHTVVKQIQDIVQFDAPATINTIDGVRVDWPDGFGLIRASNTTPVLVLRFEGHTPEALERIRTDMLALLRKVVPDAELVSKAH